MSGEATADRIGAEFKFDAFMSYSHAADGQLAPRLQQALGSLGRRWYQVRALRVFRDQSTLALTPELWPDIEKALDASRCFVLLASPAAARSEWVRREIAHWRRTKSMDGLLLVITEGEVAWNTANNDFDWERTTALPSELAGAFRTEPQWLDLRWARTEEKATPDHIRFIDDAATLAARLHGTTKDVVVGYEVARRRSLRMITTLVILALVTFATVAFGMYLDQRRQRLRADRARAEAEVQRTRANNQSELATTREVVARAQLLRQRAPALLEQSLLLAELSIERAPTSEALSLVNDTAPLLPKVLRQWTMAPGAGEIAMSADGAIVIVGNADGIEAVATSTGRSKWALRAPRDIYRVAMSRDGKHLAAASGLFLQPNAVAIWTLNGDGTAPRLLARFTVPTQVQAMDFSNSGYLMFGGSEGMCCRTFAMTIDLTSGRTVETRPIPNAAVSGLTGLASDVAAGNRYGAVAFYSGGIPNGGGSEIRLLASGQVVQAFNGELTNAVRLTTDAPLTLFSAVGPAVIVRWLDDAYRVIRTATLAHASLVQAVDIDPAGSIVVSATADGRVHLWDVASEHERWTVQTLPNFRVRLSLSHDASIVSLGSSSGLAQRWRAVDGSEVMREAHLQSPWSAVSIVASADGKVLATRSDDGVVRVRAGVDTWRWRVDPQSPEGQPIAPGRAISGDGRRIAVQASTLQLQDAVSVPGAPVASLPTPRFGGDRIVLDGAGNHVADIGPFDLSLWRAHPAKQLLHTATQRLVSSAAMTFDGTRFVALSVDGTNQEKTVNARVTVFDVESGREILRRRVSDRAEQMAIDRDGRYVALKTVDAPGTASLGHCAVSALSDLEVLFPAVPCILSPQFASIAGSPALLTADDEHTLTIREATGGAIRLRIIDDLRLRDWTISQSGTMLAMVSAQLSAPSLTTVYQRPDARIVTIVRLKDGTRLGRIELPSPVQHLRFVDDSTLLVLDEDGIAHRLAADPADLRAELCQRLSRNLTSEEWAENVGQLPCRSICPLPVGPGCGAKAPALLNLLPK